MEKSVRRKQPKKLQLIAVYEGDEREILKEAISLHTIAISDIEPGIFPVLFVSKKDIRDAYIAHGGRLTKTLRSTIDQMTDEDMIDLAGDMWADIMKAAFRDSITDNMDKQVERYHQRVRDRARGPGS